MPVEASPIKTRRQAQNAEITNNTAVDQLLLNPSQINVLDQNERNFFKIETIISKLSLLSDDIVELIQTLRGKAKLYNFDRKETIHILHNSLQGVAKKILQNFIRSNEQATLEEIYSQLINELSDRQDENAIFQKLLNFRFAGNLNIHLKRFNELVHLHKNKAKESALFL